LYCPSAKRHQNSAAGDPISFFSLEKELLEQASLPNVETNYLELKFIVDFIKYPNYRTVQHTTRCLSFIQLFSLHITMYRSMMTRRKIHMNLPVSVGTKDLESSGCRNCAQPTSSSRPKISAFWWTKKATKVHMKPTVDTKHLETKPIDRYYVPPIHSSRSQVSASSSNDACPPASPFTTPKRRTNVTFATPLENLHLPLTPLGHLRAHYRSAPLSPPLLKRKLITVDLIQDRDLQRLQIPIIQDFYSQNMDFEGEEPDNHWRKWRLSPRPNSRSYV